MKRILWQLGKALQTAPIKTVAVGTALFVGGCIAFFISFEVLFFILPISGERWLSTSPIGIPILFIGIICGVFYKGLTHPKISAMWLPTYDQAAHEQKWEERQLQTTPILEQRCHPVRTTPKGTYVGTANRRGATLHVKSAIRFWYWFLPTSLLISSFVIAPFLGGWLGYVSASNSRFYDEEVATGIFLMVGVFIALTIVSYFLTRPWVTIVITPDTITYGSTKYAREHHNGMRIGYTIEGVDELKNDFFDISFGLQAIRLTYGRWGEDLPYLVNKYHAAEIVIWMNELIAEVGAPEPKENDPAKGRQSEEF